jgi:hypothetical protein
MVFVSLFVHSLTPEEAGGARRSGAMVHGHKKERKKMAKKLFGGQRTAGRGRRSEKAAG